MRAPQDCSGQSSPAVACWTAWTGPDSVSRNDTVSTASDAMIKTTKTNRRQATLLRGI